MRGRFLLTGSANLRNLDHLAHLLTLLSAQTAQLLAIESIAKHLALRRETVQNNLAALERLFLVRRLPAWHKNEARRLVKAPKVHVVYGGLAATLTNTEVEDWITQRSRFGHLVESFAVQQLIAQAGWTDLDLQFWHYRDRDQFEVDVVLTHGRKTWGVEVKAAATVTPSDGAGLRRLAEQCGKDFQGGVILYVGVVERQHGDRFIALMDRQLPAWRAYRDLLNRAPLGHERWQY